MKKKAFHILLSILSFLLLSAAAQTKAASFFLFPETGSYSIGSTFPVSLMVDSGDVPINAAEAVLSFHAGELEVVDVSKSSSIFSFWTTEPAFSNARGIVEFAGGNSKSFIGSSGSVITITFRVLAVADTKLSFSAGSIMAADGKASNLLTDMRGASYHLQPRITIPASEKGQEPVFISEGSPQLPFVSSPTHASEGEWYADSDPEFSWEVPPDVTAVRILLDGKPSTSPTEEYSPPISEKKYKGVPDGIWYFHTRFKNNYGWGEVAHKRILIDTEPPQSFEITIDNEGDQTNPSPILSFESLDALSGINYYEVKIGEEESLIIEKPYYKITPHAPGDYTLIVRAIDKAKNSNVQTKDFIISPIASPVILDYPDTDMVGGVLTIKGSSDFPGGLIDIFISKDGKEAEERQLRTDNGGNWSFVYDKKLEEGIYSIWAKAIDERGAESYASEKITIIVAQPFIIRIGKTVIDYLTVILTLVGMLVILSAGFFYVRNKFTEWRGRLKKETKEVAQSVVKGFALLEKEIQEQIEYLDKKPGLSESEQEIYGKLRRALDKSKEIIGKEIDDVEKELK